MLLLLIIIRDFTSRVVEELEVEDTLIDSIHLIGGKGSRVVVVLVDLCLGAEGMEGLRVWGKGVEVVEEDIGAEVETNTKIIVLLPAAPQTSTAHPLSADINPIKLIQHTKEKDTHKNDQINPPSNFFIFFLHVYFIIIIFHYNINKNLKKRQFICKNALFHAVNFLIN